ncbi:hypothetical protein F5146DRAFT_1042225 [Armillaria mellea]|nr:hypothetical protein F5146DRAFT_1042225 [Armillaria mellea]
MELEACQAVRFARKISPAGALTADDPPRVPGSRGKFGMTSTCARTKFSVASGLGSTTKHGHLYFISWEPRKFLAFRLLGMIKNCARSAPRDLLKQFFRPRREDLNFESPSPSYWHWMATDLNVSSGALLAASWLNMMLYTSQLALSIYYLGHFTTGVRMYYWILASLFLDGACSVVVMANVYTYLIINEARYTQYRCGCSLRLSCSRIHPPSVAQAFFCYRYWTIARNRCITGCITILITVHMVCSLISCIVFVLHPMDSIATTIPFTIASSAICAATDLTIAGFLAWTLSRIESPYAVTRNLLRRVTIHALTCGFTTAFCTTLMSIFMFTAWNAFYTIFTILGRIYSLTILFNLILLKVTSQGDQGCTDDYSEPAILSPIYFKHNVGTISIERRSSSSGSETVRYPTYPRSRHQANDRCSIHTV